MQLRPGLLHVDCPTNVEMDRPLILADRISSKEILEKCKLEDVEVVLKKRRLFLVRTCEAERC